MKQRIRRRPAKRLWEEGADHKEDWNGILLEVSESFLLEQSSGGRKVDQTTFSDSRQNTLQLIREGIRSRKLTEKGLGFQKEVKAKQLKAKKAEVTK